MFVYIFPGVIILFSKAVVVAVFYFIYWCFDLAFSFCFLYVYLKWDLGCCKGNGKAFCHTTQYIMYIMNSKYKYKHEHTFFLLSIYDSNESIGFLHGKKRKKNSVGLPSGILICINHILGLDTNLGSGLQTSIGSHTKS
jgi:hypothetical protein